MNMLYWTGLACIGLMFVHAGMTHFLQFQRMAAMLEQRRWPMPRVLLCAGSLVQILAGFGLLYPPVRPASAAMLIVFTVWASIGLLDFWTKAGPERATMRNAFSANMAIVGGLLVIAAT